MRFLVLGASGMAGHVISIYLKEQGHEVVGYSRRGVSFVESIEGDVKDTSRLEGVIAAGHFDTIVNATGILNQYAEKDRDAAAFINSFLPHFLAKITQDTSVQIIQMSTDCVFSGKNAGIGYTENSPCDGESFYDRSKALGELNDGKNITLRNSIVGPDINEKGIGLLNWFMKQDEVKGYRCAMWTGLTTLELAKVIESAAQKRAHGLVNMVYEENISKYELLKLFNHFIRNDEVVIHPSDDISVDKTLIRTNYEFDYMIPSYETMVSEMAKWMENHKILYPYYSL